MLKSRTDPFLWLLPLPHSSPFLMISDGAGYNTFLAASMYQGKVGKQIYDGPEWVQLSCSNYPLNRSIGPTRDNQQDPIVVYDPAKAWSKARGEEAPGAFGTAGYQYMLSTYTDSAASATAMASGVKTFNNSINWKNDGTPLWGKTVAEVAKKNGRSVGMITTEPFDPIVDHGPGNLPGIKHYSSSHSNQVVPLYVRGAGAEEFRKLIVGNDPTAAKTWNISGDYVDNVSVYKVTHDAIVKDKVKHSQINPPPAGSTSGPMVE